MIPSDIARDATGSAASRQPGQAPTWTVIYDRDCGFCRWSLARVLALDSERRLRPVALRTPEANERLADLTPEERSASWHLIGPDGRRASAGAAAAPLFRLLRGGRIPAALLEHAPTLTERGYRWVANHRSWFGKLIPDAAKRRADERIHQRETSASGRRAARNSSSSSGASVSS
jgi:predicted DCC family thiol-disulfide oxidoreductase YuxK